MNLTPYIFEIQKQGLQKIHFAYNQLQKNVEIGQKRLSEMQSIILNGTQNQLTIIQNKIQKIKQLVHIKTRRLSAEVKEAYSLLNQRWEEVTHRTQQFIRTHNKTLFLMGSSLLTAYCSPIIFTVTLMTSVIATVQIDQYMNHYMHQRLNQTELSSKITIPYYYGSPCHTNALEMALGTISAIHAFFISTIFLPASLAIAILPPMLGAAATGCVCAKIGIDLAHHYNFL